MLIRDWSSDVCSSDLDWLMAAEYIALEHERLRQAPKIVLCERGVTAPHTHRATSRFLIDLQVIPAVQEVTHLPIMSDPSHATFWQPWVKRSEEHTSELQSLMRLSYAVFCLTKKQ